MLLVWSEREHVSEANNAMNTYSHFTSLVVVRVADIIATGYTGIFVGKYFMFISCGS